MLGLGIRSLGRQLARCSFKRVAIRRPFSHIYVNHRETPTNNESTPFDFTPENYKQIDIWLSKFPSNYKKSALIPVLFIAQKQNDNFLSLSAMKKVAEILEIPEIDVYEVAAFYTMFNRERVGKFHLQFCGTTPCMIRGSREIMKAAEDHLGIRCGETTQDGLFTIVEVECLGACVNAPMLQVNNEWVYEDLDEKSTINLIEQFRRGETPKVGPQIERNHSEGPHGRTCLQLKEFNPEYTIDRDFAAAKKQWEAKIAEDERKKAEMEAKKKEQAKAAEEAAQKAKAAGKA